jgi:DNA-binding LacI/PurR family transcriptional regulator
MEIDALQDREWDGVLLVYPFPEEVIHALQKLFPVVSLVQQFVKSPLDCVDVNHHRGIEMVMDHLVELGHERIGFLTNGYDLFAKWAQHRYSAFLAEIDRLQLPRNRDDIIDPFSASRLSVDEINQYAAEQTRKGVTAWVCAADHQGYQLYRSLSNQGFSIPEDLSITGFDGITPPDWAPPLTTLGIPYHDIGLAAGKRLHDLVKKRFEVPQVISIDCIFQKGATTQKI